MKTAYAKGNPTETDKIIADLYETAIEKWLLTREDDKDIDHPANWKKKSRLGDHPLPGHWNNKEEDQNQIVSGDRLVLKQPHRPIGPEHSGCQSQRIPKISRPGKTLAQTEHDQKPHETEDKCGETRERHPLAEKENPKQRRPNGRQIEKEQSPHHFRHNERGSIKCEGCPNKKARHENRRSLRLDPIPAARQERQEQNKANAIDGEARPCTIETVVFECPKQEPEEAPENTAHRYAQAWQQFWPFGEVSRRYHRPADF